MDAASSSVAPSFDALASSLVSAAVIFSGEQIAASLD
jgi:hypothetical protein